MTGFADTTRRREQAAREKYYRWHPEMIGSPIVSENVVDEILAAADAVGQPVVYKVPCETCVGYGIEVYRGELPDYDHHASIRCLPCRGKGFRLVVAPCPTCGGNTVHPKLPTDMSEWYDDDHWPHIDGGCSDQSCSYCHPRCPDCSDGTVLSDPQVRSWLLEQMGARRFDPPYEEGRYYGWPEGSLYHDIGQHSTMWVVPEKEDD